MKCILKETKQKTTLKPRELVSWVSLFPAIVPHLGFQFAFKKKNYFSFVNVSRKQSARSLGAPPPVSRAELGISLTLFLSCFLKAKVQVQKWAFFALGF